MSSSSRLVGSALQLTTQAGGHAGTGPPKLRAFTAPAVDDLRSLPAGALQRALSAGNIDHRHCIEKADLAAALHGSFDSLPLSVRSEVHSLIKAPRNELAPLDVSQALLARITRLQLDEQYSVKLFQVSFCTHVCVLPACGMIGLP